MQKAHLFFGISLFLTGISVQAQEGTGELYNFFGGRDIDYWGEGKSVNSYSLFGQKSSDTQVKGKQLQTAGVQGSTVIRSADNRPFSWKAYQDPNSPEFWDDGGDWIPPRPFREAAANPTEENILAYLDWIQRKGLLVNKFQERLSQRIPGSVQGKASEVNWDQVEIAYFYQSACPHCQSSKDTIEAAQQMGAKVTYIQLDSKLQAPLHRGSLPYDKEWAANFPVTVTPSWFLKVGSRTTKATGALSLEALKQSISTLKMSMK